MRRNFLAAALMAATSLAACGDGAPDPAATGGSGQRAPSVAAGPTGRIRGVVTFKGEAPAERVERVTENQGICGDSVPMTRLALGANAGVGNAFIYLDGIKGTGVPRTQATLQLEQERCSYAPRTMVASMGAALEIVNDDPILHNVHARAPTADGLRTLFNIAQPVRGQRTKLDAPFTTTGVVTLTCEAGHPWMAAYVLVADHPYVAVSGENGEFTIENAPAGTYPIRLWHEGVQVKRIVSHLQQYEYEDPYELRAEVVVPPDGEAVVNFELALRAQ
jgi:hypothetical protein